MTQEIILVTPHCVFFSVLGQINPTTGNWEDNKKYWRLEDWFYLNSQKETLLKGNRNSLYPVNPSESLNGEGNLICRYDNCAIVENFKLMNVENLFLLTVRVPSTLHKSIRQVLCTKQVSFKPIVNILEHNSLIVPLHRDSKEQYFTQKNQN